MQEQVLTINVKRMHMSIICLQLGSRAEFYGKSGIQDEYFLVYTPRQEEKIPDKGNQTSKYRVWIQARICEDWLGIWADWRSSKGRNLMPGWEQILGTLKSIT